jgi:glutamate/tyrosine decarboxylase-like PLP-dependent enzyme
VQGSGEAVAIIADLLASAVNQNITAWRSAPAAVTIERTVVAWLAEAVGCTGFTGSLTGGGSSANLMGLAMARQQKGADLGRATLYASAEAHMSIAKAAALLGLLRENIRTIRVDREFKMRLDDLESALGADVAAGRIPVAIVATAGAVNTGAIDPIKDIAAAARRHGAWLHVDGAYGGLAALAYPEKFIGLDTVDSLSLDPHKWFYQPMDCGCLLFRDRELARAGFAFFDESLELSRRFRALKLWLSLRYHGIRKFRESILQDVELAQSLGMKIAQHPALDLLAPVELSAVCFRYLPHNVEAERINDLNAQILGRVVRRGRVYLSNATIDGKFALRACLVNHRTTEADIQAVIDEVLAAAAEAPRG